MRYCATGGMLAVISLFLLGLNFAPSARAEDTAPNATATRPAKDPAGQRSLPNAAPPATTTQKTGSTNQNPKIKQMNEEEKQKIEKEGK
jgi:hypothetical protein